MIQDNQDNSYVHGQRGRPKGWKGEHKKHEQSEFNLHHTTLTISTSYKHYVSSCNDKDIIAIFKEDYIFIHDQLSNLISSKIIDGKRINLPFNQGSLEVQSEKLVPYTDDEGKIKGLPINWGETNKLKQKGINKFVYFLNEHTSGYIYKIFHLRPRQHPSNYRFYKLKPMKSLKDKLKNSIQNGKRYFGKTYNKKRNR